MENQFIKFERITKHLQVFPEECIYSCSKNGEKRNFSLTREYWNLKFWKFNFIFDEILRIKCENCGWGSKLPGIFARNVFRHGLKSYDLIRYAKSTILKSRTLNLWGSLWRIWLFSLGVVLLAGVIRFYSVPVQYESVPSVTFEDLQTNKYLGKIVKFSGKVDYSLALSKDVYIRERNESQKIVSTEVYMPIFPITNGTEFIVLKGGTADVQNVLGRVNITTPELLKNQEYTVTGKVELIDAMGNNQISDYYTQQLPSERSYSPPKVMIVSAGLITLERLLYDLLPYFASILVLLLSSVFIQIFIDKKIESKFKTNHK